MKQFKTLGGNGVPIDLFKTTRVSIKWSKRSFDLALKYGRVPEEWKNGIILPFFKKGTSATCSNY